jgi:cell division protein FtsI (penicillin-binding protein 3)
MRDIFKAPLAAVFKSITTWHQGLNQSSAIEIAKQRVIIITITLSIAFFLVMLRLGDVMLLQQKTREKFNVDHEFEVCRNDIVDRNNEVLATNIITASAYVNAKQIIDVNDAVSKLKTVIKNISETELREKLTSGKSFLWLVRHITPKLQKEINDLGVPGVYLRRDQTRIYPHGALCSHIVGFCGLDGEGLGGIERFYDAQLQCDKQPLQLSLDLRVQYILKDQLQQGMDEFSAKGGNAIVMNVKTGEILGMVSLPDFNPHQLSGANHDAFFNRNTLGVYEPGSVFKILNVAIALESGCANLESIYSTAEPVSIGRFKVTDFKGTGKPLTLQEAFIKSSNIASIKISQQFGMKRQQEYMKRFGALQKVKLEISELGAPIIPKKWSEASMMTISYGYGISQTPLQILYMVNGLINNGKKVDPTLVKKEKGDVLYEQTISQKTSEAIRQLMRLVVCEGTGRKADVEGYEVFGKTGTVYQQMQKGYGSDKNRQRTTTFIGGFPYQNPEIVVIAMLDDPKANKETYGYATAGWNVAKVAGHIIEKVAPLYMSPNYTSKTLQINNDVDAETPKVCSISMREEMNDEAPPF